jgi:hypothetical protein
MGNKGKVLILALAGGFGACMLCVVAIVGFAFLSTQPAATAGEEFMQALAARNFSSAYSLCSASLQAELGGSEMLDEELTSRGIVPERWSFSNRQINNDTGELEGDVTFADGRRGTVLLRLVKSADRWVISAFSLQPTP